MSYNWNDEISLQRRQQIIIRAWLWLLAMAFTMVIAAMAYYVAGLR